MSARRLFSWLEARFPSTPRALRGRAAAAASTEPTYSRSQDRGEAVLGAGHQSPAPAASTSTPSADAGQTPEGARPGTRAPSGPPRCETDLYWEPDPANRFEFADDRMATVVDRWEGETS